MKIRITHLLLVILISLSSCEYIYSLFPIYTDDSLMTLDKIEGKWRSVQENTLITFTKKQLFQELEDIKHPRSNKNEVFVDSIKTNLFSIYFRSKVEIKLQGEIYNSKEEIAQKIEEEIKRSLEKPEIDVDNGDEIEFDGEIEVYEKGTYILTYEKKDEETEFYEIHFTSLGNTIIMDVANITDFWSSSFTGNEFSDNFFPVHTFFKINLSEKNQLDIYSFDPEKLVELFERNRIRLKHEIIDNKVILTASPKEIRSFYSKYLKRASVFKASDKYERVSS